MDFFILFDLTVRNVSEKISEYLLLRPFFQTLFYTFCILKSPENTHSSHSFNYYFFPFNSLSRRELGRASLEHISSSAQGLMFNSQ